VSLFSGIAKIVAGAALIAGAVAVDIATFGTATPEIFALVTSGVGMIVSGVGTLLSNGGNLKGFTTTTRNPISPWKVCYGRCATGGTLVYLNMWGGSSKMLDMVIVLAAHPCQSVDELLFDQQRIQIDTSAAPSGAIGGTSFTPVQQTVNISSIARLNDIVTVVLPQDIPYLTAGDQITIQNVSADSTLNGVFQVAEIISRIPSGGTNVLTFTYINGGSSVSISNQGQGKTMWADYGRTVYMETLLGDQTLGHTFKGMQLPGTPWLGSGPYVSPQGPGLAGTGGPGPATIFGGTVNPWTNYCSLLGKTAVFLRLTYDEKYYQQGLPQISFRIHGKKDIYDPRSSSTGYSENAALCIADFLHNSTWGFKAPYGSEIPATELGAAADVCDQAVTLAKGGSEPRYTCNGQFELTMRRGEVLQNLLTSCAGRLTYTGGKFVIQPAAWYGSSPTAVDFMAIAAGPFRWRPTVSIRDLFNGVKGTYISPSNKWQSTDFPAYAQDTAHGYHGSSMYGGDINLAADGGDRRWLDIQLPFTISASMAQRIAKIELLRRRFWGTGTFALNMAGYQFAPLDIVAGTVSLLGWSGKLLEISAARFRADKQSDGGKEVVLLGTEVDVQETDSSIYQWATTEELSPQGFIQSQLPTWGGFVESAPFPWCPGYALPLAGDAVFVKGAQDKGGFSIRPKYGVDAQGNGTASVTIKGYAPINALDTSIASPQISAVGSSSGGSLRGGTYVVGISAYDSGSSSHANTDYQNLAVVDVGGVSSGSIVVTITWGSGDDGGELYLARWTEDGYVLHVQQTIAPGITSVTITSFNESTQGGPDDLYDHFGLVCQQIIHGGVWAQQVQAVTATTITIGGDGMTPNQWSGYTLSLLAKYDPNVDVRILNMPVSGSSASSGTPPQFTLTIGPNSAGSQLPDLTTLLTVGDLVVMRTKATFTDTSFSDPNIANPYYPGGASGVEAGRVAVVLTGADAGDVQMIDSVSGAGNTQFNLAGRWKITPAAGDLVIVCAAESVEDPTAAVSAKHSGILATIEPKVPNLGGQAWLFRVRTEDVNGISGPDSLVPMREIYLFGNQITRQITADSTELVTDGVVVCDTSTPTHPATTTTLSAAIADGAVTAITISGGTVVTGTVIQIGSERMLVDAGGGTTALTVERGFGGTTATSHGSGATVNIPGWIEFQLLDIASIPNQGLIVNKISSDINYVLIRRAGTDVFPGGATTIILPDASANRGTAALKSPGN